MPSCLRSVIVTLLLLLSVQTMAFGDEVKPQVVKPEIAAADQLYRAGKFTEAEAGYQAVLKNGSKLMPAEGRGCSGWIGAGNVAATED